MRWSPVAVEISSATGSPGRSSPTLITCPRRRMCSGRSSGSVTPNAVSARLTGETLGRDRRNEPEYQRHPVSPPQGPMALLDGCGRSIAKPVGRTSTTASMTAEPTTSARRALGGPPVATRRCVPSTTSPLPDEAFAWTAFRPTSRPRSPRSSRCATAVAASCSMSSCARPADASSPPSPPATRRVPSQGPVEHRGGGDLLGRRQGQRAFHRMQVKELLAHFGLEHGSVSQRPTR